MLIRFKNKMTMALIQMINQGKQLGGIPSCILVSSDEASQIIDEINSLREQKETQHERYKFQHGSADARLTVLARELSKDEKRHLLDDWAEGKLTITFDDIILNVVILEEKNKQYHD